MKKGLMTSIDWAHIGAVLANESDEDQAAFLKAFVAELKSWDTNRQWGIQLCYVADKLTNDEKEVLSYLGKDDK